MLDRILVPLDGSALSDRILTLVRRVLVRRDAAVMMLHVLPEPGARKGTWARMKAVEAAREHLRGIRNRLAAEGATASWEIRSGTPVDEILRFAYHYRPSLIAMTTHGRTGLERLIRGSVAEGLLRESPYPLLLANPTGLREAAHAPEARFRRILVPLDGGTESPRILPLVGEFARMYDGEVTLFHATAPAGKGGVPWDATLVLESHRRRLVDAGIAAHVLAGAGAPAEEILRVADTERMDLVAMTTHGRGGLSHLVFGTVTETVLHRCAHPLLILRTVPLPRAGHGVHAPAAARDTVPSSSFLTSFR